MNKFTPPHLIINADDLGFSKEINRAIVNLLLSSKIDRATLMVNMECADEAVSLIKSHKLSEKVGLHLNLADGEPLSSLIKDTCLCSNGYFNGTHERPSYRFYIKRNLRRAIKEELESQFEKFYQYFGSYPRHIDSHGHFHIFLPYFFIIRSLAKKYGVESMRIGINLYDKSTASFAKKMYKWVINALIKRSFIHTDYMGSYLEFSNYFRYSENTSCEIMVHPSYHDGRIVDIVYERDEKSYYDFQNIAPLTH